ncbi:Universal stress protein family protein [Candidatus Bealeia paramacronuclearis]|uniref:Universal stress protein family protein n=1 Tax=Candidatus Bealeia paramacronuclearis TaxID=1921001 RepID=A0ABZ2C515_9PROT|nr:Universal stress protein family protein [Candidatus Bealeia paramacronuclearis]
MIRSILLALDESTASASAQKLAIGMAKKLNAHIAGIGVLDEPWITAPEAVPLGAAAFKVELDTQLLDDAKRRVHSLEAGFKKAAEEAQCNYHIIDAEGFPAEEIEKAIVSHDILILGRDANFHFFPLRGMAVSVEQLLKDSPLPIILTPPEESFGKDIIFAYDGSLAAARAIHMALLLEIHKDKDVHILSINHNGKDAERQAQKIHKLCERHGVAAKVHGIESKEKPWNIMSTLVEELNIGMIVLGAYGHSGIASFFTGSTMKGLIQKAKVPLFLYH